MRTAEGQETRGSRVTKFPAALRWALLTAVLPACRPETIAETSTPGVAEVRTSVSTASSAAPKGGAVDTQAEPTVRYSVVDNGDFAEAHSGVVDARGVRRIPWWRSNRGMDAVRSDASGATVELRAGERLEQPLPAYAPLVSTLRVSGAHASGVDVVVESSGRRVARASASSAGTFELVAGSAGGSAAPSPRYDLEVVPTSDAGTCGSVAGTIELPCPTEAALRAEVVAAIDAIVRTWIERASDDVGPRRTTLLVKDFDAVTGETLYVFGAGRGPATVGFSSFYSAVFDALEVHEQPTWRAWSERFLPEFFELQLNPDTGLPRGWNPTTDQPDDATPVEIAVVFDFLIDLAEHGPEAQRAHARAAAVRIGDLVLAKGMMPDGTCAASYVPRDGTPNLGVNQLRRLDVPLRLVRLARLTGDERYARAAREALATLEFTHHWAGTWEFVDPGFDDDFGHYGCRAAAAARARPAEETFQRFAREGWEHYAPIWHDALRFGGNVAADQTRCWRIGVDLVHLGVVPRTATGELLRTAARTHFKCQQYGNGAWGDVTTIDFRPNTGIQVGDLPGVPSNLLMGLATIYTDDVGLRTDEIRAMFTAVWRSSVREYGRPFGFLTTRTEVKGKNSAVGSQRVLPALVEMLRALSAPRVTAPR